MSPEVVLPGPNWDQGTFQVRFPLDFTHQSRRGASINPTSTTPAWLFDAFLVAPIYPAGPPILHRNSVSLPRHGTLLLETLVPRSQGGVVHESSLQLQTSL